MSRVGILVSATIGFTLAALAWCIPAAYEPLPAHAGMLDRLAGLALLVMSLLLSVAVFHRVMRVPAPTLPARGRRTSEFRRGFAIDASANRQDASPIVALPRVAKDLPAPRQAAEQPIEVERLQSLLQQRLRDLPSQRPRATIRLDHHLDHQPS